MVFVLIECPLTLCFRQPVYLYNLNFLFLSLHLGQPRFCDITKLVCQGAVPLNFGLSNQQH